MYCIIFEVAAVFVNSKILWVNNQGFKSPWRVLFYHNKHRLTCPCHANLENMNGFEIDGIID